MNKFATNIKENALVGIANGAKIANNVAKRTQGPHGINICMEVDEFPFSMSTDDGATAIEHMFFEDPAEKRGLGYMKEAVGRSNQNAQDGSTATCAILSSVLEEGSQSTEREITIKNSIDELMPIIDKEIDAQTRHITIQEVENVASVAGKSKEKGRILREIYERIGKDGIIYPQGNFSFDGVTKYTITEGIKFKNTGFISEAMVHDEEAIKLHEKEKRAIYFKPAVLVSKRKIATIADINAVLEKLKELNLKDLVIFTDDMDSGVVSVLIDAHKSKTINICIIKAPTVYKNSVFYDFAKCTGATILEDGTGVTFKNFSASHFGTCDVLIADAEETKIIGPQNPQNLMEHVAELKTKTDVESQMRVCWLTALTAVLEIGAMSETDLSYHRLKYDDAIGSSQRALNSGIVPGGGIALFNVANKLPDTIGGRILKKALRTPFEQLCDNSLIKPDYDKIGGEMGYDLISGEVVNMFDKGLVDASLVVKNSVKNAIGIASTAITTPYLLTLPVETPEQIAYKMMQQKGLRM